jgi:AcrR family transcriptional regulator
VSLVRIHSVSYSLGVNRRAPSPTAHALTPARGRPRSEQARHAILKAGIALVEQRGYPALTIEAVAERAGVARTTIYRWWPNRALLGVDVLVEIATAAAPPPANCEPLRVIRLELRRVAIAAAGVAGSLLLALLSEAQFDPDVRDAVHSRVTYPRRDASARVVRAAQDSGLLSKDVSTNVLVDLLYGPVFYRLLMGHEPPTARFAEQVFECVIAGIGKPRK